MNKGLRLLNGAVAIIWAFLFSILCFKGMLFLSKSCDFKRLIIALIVITCIIAVLVWNIFKNERKNNQGGESNDNKEDGV